MMVTSSMTSVKVKVHLNGKMVESTKENGKMENSMALEYLLLKINKLKRENGKMVRKLDG